MVLTWLPVIGVIAVALVWLMIVSFREYSAFDLVILLGTLCLPFLSSLLVALGNVNTIDYQGPGRFYQLAVGIQFLLISVAIGLLWDHQRQRDEKGAYDWIVSAGIHYAISVVLFTTVLTNGFGLATGFIGSLGYWLVQQDVERGSQPMYYYAITVGLYEYLPLLLAALVAPIYGLIRFLVTLGKETKDRLSATPAVREYFVPFLIWWIVMSWISYSAAGERMPWLTVHLALPMILLSGWLVGWFLEKIDWAKIARQRGWLLALTAPLVVMALIMLFTAIRAGVLQGFTLDELQVTGQFLNGIAGLVLFGALGVLAWRAAGWRTAVHVLLLILLLIPVGLTIRTAWRFCFINDEYPTEFLVYAHASPGVAEAMDQIDELSRRVAGGPNQIQVAYGADGSTLFYWQLRNYPNASFFGDNPSREQMEYPVIIAGRDDWDVVTPYVGDDYIVNTYTFLWWPMQDYFYLTDERIDYAIANEDMRAALWDIWYDRDYTRYDELTGKSHTLSKWVLRHEFKLYIRRDVAAQMWDLSTLELSLIHI